MSPFRDFAPNSQHDHLSEAAKLLSLTLRLEKRPHHTRSAIILGSGWGKPQSWSEKVFKPLGFERAGSLPYAAIPHFPESRVEGHSGELTFFHHLHHGCFLFAGRNHLYEGYLMDEIVFSVRLAHLLGATSLIVTNAAGGLNSKAQVGDFMLIEDHLNLLGGSPLQGKTPVLPNTERFCSMQLAYDAPYRTKALEVAKSLQFGEQIWPGIYAAVPGPEYETLSELRMLERLGADAVGMSTVPEVIAARSLSMRVLGLSLITNTSHDGRATTHTEVLETAKKARPRAYAFFRGLLPSMFRLG
jgi:purine-nucleoside phosphorylase